MTPALRWTAMRGILITNCKGQNHETVSTDHNFSRARRAEAESNRGPSACQPNALPPGQTASHNLWCATVLSASVSLSALHRAHTHSSANASATNRMAFAISHTSVPASGTISSKTSTTLRLVAFKNRLYNFPSQKISA